MSVLGMYMSGYPHDMTIMPSLGQIVRLYFREREQVSKRTLPYLGFVHECFLLVEHSMSLQLFVRENATLLSVSCCVCGFVALADCTCSVDLSCWEEITAHTYICGSLFVAGPNPTPNPAFSCLCVPLNGCPRFFVV